MREKEKEIRRNFPFSFFCVAGVGLLEPRGFDSSSFSSSAPPSFFTWLFSVVWNFVEKDDFQLSSVVKFKEKKWEMLKNKALQPSTDTDMLSTETTFESLGLDPRLTRALARSNFIKPTLVQATAIPIAFQVFFLSFFFATRDDSISLLIGQGYPLSCTHWVWKDSCLHPAHCAKDSAVKGSQSKPAVSGCSGTHSRPHKRTLRASERPFEGTVLLLLQGDFVCAPAKRCRN